MRRFSALAGLASAGALLAACGGAVERPPGSPEDPAIEAVDEPAPAEVEAGFRQLAGLLGTGRVPAEKRAVIEAIAPAPDTAFRIVARLRLTGARRGVVLELVTWRSRTGALCTATLARTPSGAEAGGAGPNGPCMPLNRCRSLCVEQGQVEVGGRGTTIVAGTVASDANELRLGLLGGGVRDIPLAGPSLAHDPGLRIVLFDLGRSSYTHVELVRDGRVVERREEDAYDYATEDCIERALERERDPGDAGCF